MLQTPVEYTMKISRLSIDKLGIQTYDRVSWSAEFRIPCNSDGVNKTSEIRFSEMNAARARDRKITSSGIT